MDNRTIAAVATANAPAGIGVIRISGENALAVADAIFKPVDGVPITESKGYRAHFGEVYDKKIDEKIDDAVCLAFRAPKSYTGEDVAEISCHGGPRVAKRVLRAALDAGAEPALAGEFTKKAFLNGKIDLARAESVAALIGAAGRRARLAALNALDGVLSREIRDCADALVERAASIAAWIDYPDEDIEDADEAKFLSVFTDVRSRLLEIINRFDRGRVLTEGVDAAIVGRPNVGKSSLMNMLVGFERSIVDAAAGTTRDVVEEKIVLGDVILRVADTAGIRKPESSVENLGVSFAKRRLERAELILAVFDSSEPPTDDDREIIRECKGKKAIAILNKIDLPPAADGKFAADSFKYVVETSAVTGEGLDKLEKAVCDLFSVEEFDPDEACLTSERQRRLCADAVSSLDDAVTALKEGATLDAVEVCADCAINSLLELTGERAESAVVDEVFSRFCVGK